MRLALQAAGVGPGDEVIVPVNTFIATAEAVSHCGATPVFVDCLPSTANIDPSPHRGRRSRRARRPSCPCTCTGSPPTWRASGGSPSEHGLAVVEDACQAHGATFQGRPCGSMGVTAAFSFYPGKNLGRARRRRSRDDQRRRRRTAAVRLLRNHGELTKSVHEAVGYCDRLHNLQAGFLLAKLPHLDGVERGATAPPRAAMMTLLARVAGVTPVRACATTSSTCTTSTWCRWTTETPCGRRLGARGVQTGIHYPVPLHLTPAYAGLGYARGDFPVAEALAARILSLPMFPQLTAEQQEYVVERLLAARRWH